MKKKLDYKDVQIVWLRDGPRGLEEVIEGGLASEFTLRRSVREMRDNGDYDNAAELEEWLRSRGFIRQHRNTPDAGDVKIYRVQRSEPGPFVRAPVDSLGVSPGEEVRLRFFIDRITIEPVD